MFCRSLSCGLCAGGQRKEPNEMFPVWQHPPLYLLSLRHEPSDVLNSWMSPRTPPPAPHWWQLPWRQILSFPVGVGVIVWQTTIVDQAQVALVLFGAAAMGVLPAAAVRELIKSKIGGD